MSETFYDVLDVSADASETAIKDAYREKVKEYHPDVCDRPDAAERFKRVKRAEEVLCDPDERAAYDRLGHDTYVGNGAGTSSNDGSAGTDGATTVSDVREAAARTAGRDHDAGGRSAGWRERERRASRRRAEDWFGGSDDAPGRDRRTGAASDGAAESGSATTDEDDWYSAGFDYENPGSRWTYSPPADEETADESAPGEEAASGSESTDAPGSARSSPSSTASGSSATSGTDSTSGADSASGADAASGDASVSGTDSTSGDASASGAASAPGDAATTAGHAGSDGPSPGSRSRTRPSSASGDWAGGRARPSAGQSRHAATEAWGHREGREHTHAVHDWTDVASVSRIPRPNWTQDDVVLLAATLFLYPIFLLLTAIPAFHLSVNVVAGIASLAYVAGLLPKPSMALPVFGTWSVGMPALLLSFDVPVASVAFLVAVGGVWVPFLFAVAVASVLIR